MEAMVVQPQERESLPVHGQGQCLLPHRILSDNSPRGRPRLDDSTPSVHHRYSVVLQALTRHVLTDNLRRISQLRRRQVFEEQEPWCVWPRSEGDRYPSICVEILPPVDSSRDV
jgi:hypothetical protein